MKCLILKEKITNYKGNFLSIPLTEEMLKKIQKKPKTSFEKLVAQVSKDEEFKAEFKHETYFPSEGTLKAKTVQLIGLGKEKKLDYERLRKAGSIGYVKASSKKKEKFGFVLLETERLELEKQAKAVAEGILLSSYSFDKYKTEKKNKKKIKQFELIFSEGQESKAKKAVKEAETLCENVFFVRDLINENASIVTPEFMEKKAKEISKKLKLKTSVVDHKQLKKIGAHLLLSVGQSAQSPPRMVFLEYKGNPKSKKKIAFIGKGITFDSGGLNLKPTGYMETMREDMAGSATVLGTIKAAAEMKLKVNLVAGLALAENSIDSKSYKPGDTFKSYSGKTVEIGNTDAEGRLALADTINYAIKKFNPDLVVDMATLTGAIVVGLGDKISGVFTNNKFYSDQYHKAGWSVFERNWELPLIDEYRERMKGDLADLKNSGGKRGNAGSITAAAFLEYFVEKKPWIHVDIAGTSWADKKEFYTPKNATGNGLRTNIEFLKKISFEERE